MKLITTVHPKVDFGTMPESNERQFLFVVSHLGSGYGDLKHILDNNPRIDLQETTISYQHPKDIEYIKSFGHKLGKITYGDKMVDSSKVYGDILLHNYCFSCKPMYEFCKFIYLIRPASHSIKEILKDKSYISEKAYLYYSYRMRRICEMARNTPGAILLTWGDLQNKRGLDLMQEYLGLIEPLSVPSGLFVDPEPTDFPISFIKKIEDCYERHYFYLRSLQLKQPVK